MVCREIGAANKAQITTGSPTSACQGKAMQMFSRNIYAIAVSGMRCARCEHTRKSLSLRDPILLVNIKDDLGMNWKWEPTCL